MSLEARGKDGLVTFDGQVVRIDRSGRKQLGHASYHVRTNVYSHVAEAVARDAAETVAGLFLGETAG